MAEETTDLEEAKATDLVGQERLADWQALTRSAGRLRKAAGAVVQAAAGWDLQKLRGAVESLSQELSDTGLRNDRVRRGLDGFSLPQGEALAGYVAEFERLVRQKDLTLDGAFPEYTIFPLEVRFDLAKERVMLGRRQLTLLEPVALVEELARRHRAMQGQNFNARRFQQILGKAYDLVVEGQRREGQEASLERIYDILTLRTGTGEYPRTAFAFDIFRLRRSPELVQDGRQMRFESGRRGGFDVPKSGGGAERLSILRIWEDE